MRSTPERRAASRKRSPSPGLEPKPGSAKTRLSRTDASKRNVSWNTGVTSEFTPSVPIRGKGTPPMRISPESGS